MSLSSLQELLHLTPGRIHEVGIKLHDITDATAVAAALQVRLSQDPSRSGDGLAGTGAGAGRLRAVQSRRHLCSLFYFFPVGGHRHHEHHADGGLRAHPRVGHADGPGNASGPGDWSHHGGGGGFGRGQSGFGRQRLALRCSGICRFMVWTWAAPRARWSLSPEWWWAISGTAGRIFPPTLRPPWGWPSRLLCPPSIPRGELLTFGQRKRSERSKQ